MDKQIIIETSSLSEVVGGISLQSPPMGLGSIVNSLSFATDRYQICRLVLNLWLHKLEIFCRSLLGPFGMVLSW